MIGPRMRAAALKLAITAMFLSIGSSAIFADSRSFTLHNSEFNIHFGNRGITSLEDAALKKTFAFAHDGFSVSIDGHEIKSEDLRDPVAQTNADSVRYLFDAQPYRIEVVYHLAPNRRFISKRLIVTGTSSSQMFHVEQVEVINVRFSAPPGSDYVATSRWVKPGTTGRDYGIFKRFADRSGIFALVQNPFLTVNHDPVSFSISYSPGIAWKSAYGAFQSDVGCIGTYELSGQTVPVTAASEWVWKPASIAGQSVEEDEAEISAFTKCVQAFVLDTHAQPIDVHVGWTENDYQIDVAKPKGRAEYKRIIDRAASLGAKYVVFGPSNTDLSAEKDDADAWHWEHVLWLGLGQKIRKGEWDAKSGPIPDSVQEMLDYAKSKKVELVAYVYPTLPFSGNPDWLVGKHKENASLANREFQDWLIEELLAFYRRTGIGGYSFDYTWLDLPGATEYAQWWGWRRIMEALRASEPNIIIDGRQRYQAYGPWSWLAGSYPHPTSTDEQPESFTPFPDLHFDRVSANRERYTAYLYRIDDFCPSELMPGFIGHQTPRNDDTGQRVNTSFRQRDWDYLGWRYSLISSVAVAGLNNVINMIPARDLAEDKYFSQTDERFFRHWLNWADQNRAYLLGSRFILGQPQIGKIDGTSAVIANRGYIFLFNPNGRKLEARWKLDQSVGLSGAGAFLLRELYPQEGELIGKPGAGFWNYGDEVHMQMDGASAIVLEIAPAPRKIAAPLLFNAPGNVALNGVQLTLTGVRGEAGSTTRVEVLLPADNQIRRASVNGHAKQPSQAGKIVTIGLNFQGASFGHMEQVGVFDPNFAGGTFRGSFIVPQRIFDQLAARQKAWPIAWTTEDLKTTWLAPQRLLLFVQIAEPSDHMSVHMTLDGTSVELQKAYSSVRADPGSFVGFYADVSNLQPGHDYKVELALPMLRPGQFQGLFFDNVEPVYTDEVAP